MHAQDVETRKVLRRLAGAADRAYAKMEPDELTRQMRQLMEDMQTYPRDAGARTLFAVLDAEIRARYPEMLGEFYGGDDDATSFIARECDGATPDVGHLDRARDGQFFAKPDNDDWYVGFSSDGQWLMLLERSWAEQTGYPPTMDLEVPDPRTVPPALTLADFDAPVDTPVDTHVDDDDHILARAYAGARWRAAQATATNRLNRDIPPVDTWLTVAAWYAVEAGGMYLADYGHPMVVYHVDDLDPAQTIERDASATR